jgi:hypothetical protein
MGLDDRSEVARIATRLADAANLYREACDLLDDPELRACFAGRHALRDALSRGLRDGDGAGGDPSGSFLPTTAQVALKLRALIASGEYAALTSVHDADEELLAVIGDYLHHGDPSRETEHMVRYVRDALVADRGPPERISRTLRKQPG